MPLKQKQFQELITFSRASEGGRFNEDGLFEMVAAGQPRFDYDPVTKECKGLLVEESRTNLVLYSTDFSMWSGSNGSVSPSTVLAPDGSFAYHLMENQNNTVHGITRSGHAVVGSTTYCRSVFAKADGSGRKLFLETDSFGQWGATGNVIFNLDDGVVFSASENITNFGIEVVGGGWFRCWLASKTIPIPLDVPVDVQVDVQVVADGDPIYQGDGTSGIYIFGYQFELGSFPTSYIPTTSHQVTRAADRCALDVNASWYSGGTGTIVMDAETFAPLTAADGADGRRTYFDLSSGGNANSLLLFLYLGGAGVVSRASGGKIITHPVIGPPAANAKCAVAFDGTNLSYANNGVVVFRDAKLKPETMKVLYIGTTLGVTRALNGHIRKINYYPRRLSNKELQELTA